MCGRIMVAWLLIDVGCCLFLSSQTGRGGSCQILLYDLARQRHFRESSLFPPTLFPSLARGFRVGNNIIMTRPGRTARIKGRGS